MTANFFDQNPYDLRCEWGLEGTRQLSPTSGAVIIVDVFSFSTSVDIAASRGAWIYPYRWKDERSQDFARSVGAILAAGSRTDPHSFSLAPSSMLRVEPGMRIVLPSPNGATLSLETGETPTFAGCLRSAASVAAEAARAAAPSGGRVSVIPAGERWQDGTLRPALEDLLAAGAILQALSSLLPGSLSPEAEAAVAVFERFRARLPETFAAIASGKEAVERGRAEDLQLAAALNASTAAPRLVDGAYRDITLDPKA